MFRVLISLAVLALLMWSCSSDTPSSCSGQDPDFTVVLKLAQRPLPLDTVVLVAYAGTGKDDFRLSDPSARHEVTFCRVADENGVPLDASAPQSMGAAGAVGAAGAAGAAGAVGAAGADSSSPAETVQALHCDFYTGGFTQITVSGTGFTTMKYELTPKAGACTVEKALTLDDPDAG